MDKLRFEWDDKKSVSNFKKHGINFEEASTAFYDENARLIHDPDHSISEERYVLLGISVKLRFLVVVHIYKDKEEIIRIISARKATKTETKYYSKIK